MCVASLDPCEVWEENRRKAKKPHRCSSCGSEIAKGQEYIAHFSVFEREPSSEKMCLACDKDRSEFADAHGGTRGCPSYFPDMLRECVDEGDEESVKWKTMLDSLKARGQERTVR